MKVSHNWLKDLVDINITPIELSEKLSIGGFEVESLTDCSLNVKDVVLGKVLSVEKHINSDKLSICSVDIGLSSVLQIICGANNIRPDIYVYVAPIGSYLKAVDLEIKSAEIRGVLSEGMICSLQELGLEQLSKGVAVIEESLASKYKLGHNAADILQLNDFIYDLAITANRPDGMSLIGIAREVSALLETNLSLPNVDYISDINILKTGSFIPEAIDNESIYSVSFIENVDGNFISPKWIKDRLEISDIKSINQIVDITNYILLEQGQPLHAFDREKLSTLIGRDVRASDFGVRNGRDDEKLIGLDGKCYLLNSNVTVITCDDKPVAIAGIIGGLETSVTETTTSICLEAAVFNPSVIRGSSKEIGLRTESSSRYEKGISYKNTLFSVCRSIDLFKRFYKSSKYKVYASRVVNNDNNSVRLRRSRIHKILGPIVLYDPQTNLVEKRLLNDSEIVHKLQLIGCSINNMDGGWDVSVIPNRSQDLIREIDLIEEIARLIGYDMFDQKIPEPVRPGKLTNFQLAARKLKNSLVNSGFNEVLTYSLVQMDKEKDQVKISNPLVSELSCLRDSIWQDHLKICDQNIKSGSKACWIFEIGNIFITHDNDNIQKELISGAICGDKKLSEWNTSGKKNSLDYYQARGKLQQAISSLNVSIQDKLNDKFDHLHPGRSSILIIEGKESGYFGQIHPKLLLGNKLIKNLYLFSIDSDNLLNAAIRKSTWNPIYKNYATVPSIERDVSFVFDKKYLVAEIINFIKKSGKSLLENVNLIDIYNDKTLSNNFINYTFRLIYRDKDKTLQESDISELHNNLIDSIENNFSAKQRI